MGRGITIPKFGIFTFSAPEFILDGVTNPLERDKQHRIPVFLISKDFARGKMLKTGIYIENHIRPYLVQTNGKIQCTKINLAEISYYSQIQKENVAYGINRMIRIIEDKCRQNENVDVDIPAVGIFKTRNGTAAVAFKQDLIHITKGITNQPIEERKKKGEMNLTADTLKVLEYRNSVDQIRHS